MGHPDKHAILPVENNSMESMNLVTVGYSDRVYLDTRAAKEGMTLAAVGYSDRVSLDTREAMEGMTCSCRVQ